MKIIFTSYRFLNKLIKLPAIILLPSFTFKCILLLFRRSATTIFLSSKNRIFFSIHKSYKKKSMTSYTIVLGSLSVENICSNMYNNFCRLFPNNRRLYIMLHATYGVPGKALSVTFHMLHH